MIGGSAFIGGRSGGPIIAPRKVVKKKRGKRVGVASGGMGDVVDVPDPEDDEYADARQDGMTTTAAAAAAAAPTSNVVASWGNGGGGMAGVVSSRSVIIFILAMWLRRGRGLFLAELFFYPKPRMYQAMNWYSSPAKEIWLNPKYHLGGKFTARLSS